MSERDIFVLAREIAEPAARAAYLDTACGDAGSRRRVERLLRAEGERNCVIDVPVAAWAGADDPLLTEAFHTTPAQVANAEADVLRLLAPSARPDSLGKLGHYEMLEVLGRGGFGVVFRAFDEVLHRVVAVKVLAPALAVTATPCKRFLREARAAARVRHENVVQVYAVEEQPLPFLVMEYIPGETLERRIHRAGALGTDEVLSIGRQVAEGLAAAHATGLIHRDVKPANVLIESGERGRVKLTDFGLARAADDGSLSHSGMVVGTPSFMSPEQTRGEDVDARSDLFSLGSLLYTACAGRPPFRAATAAAVFDLVAEGTPRPIREAAPDTPAWLCEVVGRLHAKKPAARYQSASEVAEAMSRPPVVGQAASLFPKKQAGSSPYGKRVAAAVVLLLAGLGLSEATGVTRMSGTVIRLLTSEGTLIVETDDPAVSIAIDGEELTITGAGVKELRVKPGRYAVEARRDGKLVRQELVTVVRNGKQVVKISREPPAAPSADPDRRAAEWLREAGRCRVVVKVGDRTEYVEWDQDLPEGRFRLAIVQLGGGRFEKLGDRLADELAGPLTGVRLEGVGIGRSSRTTAGVAKLLRLPALANVTFLAMSDCQVDDAVFAHLAKLPALNNLDLAALPRVTGQGVGALRVCPNLGMLTMISTPVSAEAIVEMRQLPALDYLNLSASPFTARHVAAVAKLRVGALILGSCGIDDAAAAHLTDMPRLGKLVLAGNPITDRSVPALGKLTSLLELDLGASKITAEGAETLRKLLPKCKISGK